MKQVPNLANPNDLAYSNNLAKSNNLASSDNLANSDIPGSWKVQYSEGLNKGTPGTLQLRRGGVRGISAGGTRY